MSRIEQDEVMRAANAIKRYLGKHPEAVETAAGVARWWLLRQRYEDTEDLVQQALDYLVGAGQVEKVKVPGNKAMYRIARAMRRTHA